MMRSLRYSIVLAAVSSLLLSGCFEMPPEPYPTIAISQTINKERAGDYLLHARIKSKEGACTEGQKTKPCTFDVEFELMVRDPKSENGYEPVANFPKLVQQLQDSAKRIVWEGGEMRGNPNEGDQAILLKRSKEFRQAIFTGTGFTITLISEKPVNLFPLTNPENTVKEKLQVSTRVALQCAACDGELPEVREAGSQLWDSWW